MSDETSPIVVIDSREQKKMPDITKCASDHCERKEQCWRYVCEPSPFWQAYSAFNPENCELFIDVEQYDE